MADWSFLTNHARVLLCIAHDPGARLRDIAAILGITERRAHGIINDLAEAGYVVKRKDGRRNRYEIQADLPLPEPGTREPAVGEVLAVLLGTPTALPDGQTPPLELLGRDDEPRLSIEQADGAAQTGSPNADCGNSEPAWLL